MTFINFSCTNIPVFEVLQCSLNLTETELEILESLTGNATTREVSQNQDISMSMAQRAMKSLHDRDLVTRRQVNKSNGGYTYVYERQPRDHLVARVQDIIDTWSENAKDAVEDEAFTVEEDEGDTAEQEVAV